MKKAYIATRLENWAKHHEVRDALARVHVSLSYDWTAHGSIWQEGGERIREVSHLEAQGVADADFVIVILPGGRGTHAELGIALGLGKQVYLLMEEGLHHRMMHGPETCAFYHHKNVIPVYGIPHLMNYICTCELR